MAKRNHHSELRALNSHMNTALVSMFLTGTILIALGLIFGLQIIESTAASGFLLDLFMYVSLSIIVVGVLLILVGTFEAFGLMRIIKAFLKKIAAGEISFGRSRSAVSQDAQSAAVSQGAQSAGNTPQATGIGRPLTIVRPTLREAEVPERSKQPKPKQARVQAPKSKAPLKTPPPSSAKSKEESEADEETLEIDMTLEEGLQSIVDRYNTEKVQKAFKNWKNTLMMTFPDLDTSYLYKIHGDTGIELVQGVDEDAAVQVKIDSIIFLQMMTKQINPIKAYSSGKLEVQGQMKNLLKLRKLMF